MGVLNSCVMLLMKSFLISLNFFCLNATEMVYRNTPSSRNVNASDGTRNFTDEKM